MEGQRLSLSFTDNIGALTQSYTDIRRLAAENAAKRLQTMMAQQCPQNESKKEMSSKLDMDTVRLVSMIWEYVLKYQDVLAYKIFKRVVQISLRRNSDVDNAVRLDKCQTDNTRRLYKSQEVARNGRCLIEHIADVVRNLRSLPSLKKSLRSKISMLVAAGCSRESTARSCHSLTDFLAEHLPSHWSHQTEAAWISATAYILHLGSVLWDKVAKKSSGRKKNTAQLPSLATSAKKKGKANKPFRP